jgi:ribosomal protein S17E
MTFFVQLKQLKNRISGVMVSVLASCAVDREFEPRLGQTHGENKLIVNEMMMRSALY